MEVATNKQQARIRVEFNIWVLAEAYGYVIQSKPYQGVKGCLLY